MQDQSQSEKGPPATLTAEERMRLRKDPQLKRKAGDSSEHAHQGRLFKTQLVQVNINYRINNNHENPVTRNQTIFLHIKIGKERIKKVLKFCAQFRRRWEDFREHSQTHMLKC